MVASVALGTLDKARKIRPRCEPFEPVLLMESHYCVIPRSCIPECPVPEVKYPRSTDDAPTDKGSEQIQHAHSAVDLISITGVICRKLQAIPYTVNEASPMLKLFRHEQILNLEEGVHLLLATTEVDGDGGEQDRNGGEGDSCKVLVGGEPAHRDPILSYGSRTLILERRVNSRYTNERWCRRKLLGHDAHCQLGKTQRVQQ